MRTMEGGRGSERTRAQGAAGGTSNNGVRMVEGQRTKECAWGRRQW